MQSSIRKSLVHPRTGLPLVPVGFRKDGRAIWPILGAEDPPKDEKPDPPKDEKPDPPKDEKPDPPKDEKTEKPSWYISMSDEAKAEYDKLQKEARKHEDRSKVSNTKLTAAEQELEKVRRGSLSAAELAAEEAKQAGIAEANAKNAPRLVRSEFKAQLASKGVKLKDEDFTALMETFDAAKFLDQAGEVDEAKVTKIVNTIGPTKPVNEGPGVTALGKKLGVSGSSSAERGAAMFDKLHPAKTPAGAAARDWSK